MAIDLVTLSNTDKNGSHTLSNGNLTDTMIGASNNNTSIRTTSSRITGKYYWEIKLDSGGIGFMIGIAAKDFLITSSSSSSTALLRCYSAANGNKYPESTAYGTAIAVGNIIGVALDLDNGKLEFYKNGVSMGVSHTNLSGMGEVFPFISNTGNVLTSTVTYNFGATSFAYTIPSGYSAYNQVILKKTIVLHSGQYKYYNTIWTPIGNGVNENDYLTYGMDDISIIPESAWSELIGTVELCSYTDDITKTEASFNIETAPFTLAEEWEDKEIKIIEYTDDPSQTQSTITLETEPFSLYDELGDTVDVLYYTDDPSKTSANLNVTANYSPLDEIEGDFEVVTWTNDKDIVVGNEPTFEYDALPFEQLIIQPSDFLAYGAVKSFVTSKIGDGRLRFITSFDSGTTWKIYRFGKWRLINKADLVIVRKKGMSADELNVIPESDLVGVNRLGYYLDNSIHNSLENVQLDYVKVSSLAPTQDVKFSDVAFYLLNTTATIQIALQGNKIVGTLDDTDTGRVQYRVFLNGNPYYPASGDFSPLMPSPLNIRLNISEKDVVFGQDNVLKVEFQDYWGQIDYWETTFVGTYSGIMFKDESGSFYSNSLGEILKHLEFGDLIAGQSTLEQKVIVKNQLGVQVQNLILEVQKDKLPEGVTIELSRSNFPFTAEDPLLFNMFFNEDEEFQFYTRIVTDIQAPPAANGEFEVRAKADPV